MQEIDEHLFLVSHRNNIGPSFLAKAELKLLLLVSLIEHILQLAPTKSILELIYFGLYTNIFILGSVAGVVHYCLNNSQLERK